MDSEQKYLERQKAYLEGELSFEPEPGRGVSEPFTQIPRLALGVGPLNEPLLRAALNLIHERDDCADFALSGLLRVLYRFGDSPLLTPSLRAEIEEAVLGFCYWYDQPGVRGMCFHTENHQILFHECEVLAGQLFPERTFRNAGQTGAWHKAHGEALARQWFDQRARFGFSEWLSNCYFDEDLLALLNLYDFAEDPELRRMAGQMVDMLMLEIALHQYKGVLATSTGRTYVPFIMGGRAAPTTSIAWLVFGFGAPQRRTNFTMMSLCTSNYRVPAVVQAIANDCPPEITLRERHGLNASDAANYGILPDRLEDNMFFWACQTSRHPIVRPTALRVAKIAEDPWLVDFVNAVDDPLETCRRLAETGGATFDGDAVNTAISEANLITFRTPDYQLSSAQDFRPGKPGYQQHPWQASFDPDAVIFTTHPGTDNESGEHTARPNFWAGNRWLPRVGQHRNVAVIIHHVPQDDPRPYSHAYFPRTAFDQVVQHGNWTFARKENGYVALYSQNTAQWAESGAYEGIELRADAPDNIWICELGSAAQHGTFEDFVSAIRSAPVDCEGLNVRYQSPSVGEVRFGWTGPLTAGGEEVALRGYPRFDNPYVQAEIGARSYEVRCGGEQMVLKF